MNWLQLLIPVIQAIIQRLLEKKVVPAMQGSEGKEVAFVEDHRARHWVAQLEQVKKEVEASQSGKAAGAEGVAAASFQNGLIGDVQALIDAIKAKDATAIKNAILSLLSKL